MRGWGPRSSSENASIRPANVDLPLSELLIRCILVASAQTPIRTFQADLRE